VFSAVCQQLATTTGLLASDSKTSLQFSAESPREVELLAQQYVMLYCNNVPQNSTITVIDGDSREDHESPASFPEWILKTHTNLKIAALRI
jgi:hypothetical protein